MLKISTAPPPFSTGAGAERNRVEDIEKAGVQADGARQRRDSHERKPRLPAEAPQRIRDVLRDALEPGPIPHASGLLTRACDIAKRTAAGVCGVGTRHAGLLQPLLFLRAMELHLFGQLRFDATLAE